MTSATPGFRFGHSVSIFGFQIFAACATFQDRTHGWQGGPADKGDFFIRGSALPSVGRLLHLAEDWKAQ